MGAKILLVEDSRVIRAMVGATLRPFDCTIIEANDGLEGLDLAERHKPDLIILDYSMPEMDGYEMLTRLRQVANLRAIPVMMLTSEASRDKVVKILKLGVKDYLVKPLDEEVIAERIGRLVPLNKKPSTVLGDRRYDDPLKLLVVDNKSAIVEQVKDGVKDTPWDITGIGDSERAMAWCLENTPDIIFVNLALPEKSAFSLLQNLRANDATNAVPVIGLSVKTALEQQSAALQAGFACVVTKPIDYDELKIRVTRSLSLDTSYKYFDVSEEVLIIRMRETFNSNVATEIGNQLRSQLSDAVDSGIGKMMIDMSQIKYCDVTLIKFALNIIALGTELSLKYCLVGSKAIKEACASYEETKDWVLLESVEQGSKVLDGEDVAVAA